MTLHFAYGSNMSRALVRRHAPDAQPVGLARLGGYRFIITRDGYASVLPAPGEIVHGVLWRLTPRDVATLNAYENIDSGLYRRAMLPCLARRSAKRRSSIWRASAREGRPRPGYLDAVVAAARDWDLPASYIRSLQALVADAVARRARAGDRRARMTCTRHVIIRGRVQGVGYRAFVEERSEPARRRRLGAQSARRDRRGGVRRPSGSRVQDMIEACRKGPHGSRVDGIEQREARADDLALRGTGRGFAVLPTVLSWQACRRSVRTALRMRRRSAMSTSAMLTGRPRSARLVTP